MIMDATPSPQSVGREFVRQYYTLLNKAPDHLHRFYNNHSSFVHGGLEPHNREATLVVGQKQIYNKIQQLNFRDCHAKISQVDAQSTLGNGVVVQVTGELSNDGQPMRRFTQTFVLAAQSPKKYYVHNDIFRYQDFITDDEGDGESRSDNDDEQDTIQDTNAAVVETNNQTNSAISAQQQQIYYPMGVNSGVQAYQSQSTQINGVVQHDEIQTTQNNIGTTNNSNVTATNNASNLTNATNVNNTLAQGNVTVQTQAQLQKPQSQPHPVDQSINATVNAPTTTTTVPPINENLTDNAKDAALHNDIAVTTQGESKTTENEETDENASNLNEFTEPVREDGKFFLDQ